jgi:hypothetical protein
MALVPLLPDGLELTPEPELDDPDEPDDPDELEPELGGAERTGWPCEPDDEEEDVVSPLDEDVRGMA